MIQLARRSCVQSVIDASPMMAGRATAVIMSSRPARKTPSPRSVRKRTRGASSGRAGSTPTSRLYRGPRPLDNPSSIVHIKDCLWRMPDEGRGPGNAPPARHRVRESIVPLARAISAAGLSADALTVGGFLVSLAAALVAASGAWLAAGVVVVVGSLFDLFDGAVGRGPGSG